MARRRATNEGTVYQRKDGRWCAQVSLPHGKRRTFYGATQADVRAKLTQAVHDLGHRRQPAAERLRVADYLTTWLADVATRVRPRTADG